MVFGLFRKKKRLKLTPEQDAFLAAAIEEHNRNNEILKSDWGFEDFAEWGFDQTCGDFFLKMADESLVKATGQIYGSFSTDDCSWEWGWNNPHVDEAAKQDVRQVKEYGRKEGLGYLCTGFLDLTDEMMATYLAAIAEKVCGAEKIGKIGLEYRKSLFKVLHISAGVLDPDDVGMAGQDTHQSRGYGDAGGPGDVVDDQGDVRAVGQGCVVGA